MIPQRGKSKVSAEDLALLKRIRAGDRLAEELLVTRFEPFLKWRAGRCFIPEERLDREDLMQWYRITTVECARRWKPDQAAFSTYLTQSLINCEHRLHERARTHLSVFEDPKFYVLSADVEVGRKTEDRERLMDLLVDASSECPFARVRLRDWVRSVLADRPRDLFVIEKRFGLDGSPALSGNEVGARMGMGRMGSCWRLKSALKHLRAALAAEPVEFQDVVMPEGRS